MTNYTVNNGAPINLSSSTILTKDDSNNENTLLIRIQVESFTPGTEEIDFFRGGGSRNTFVLGDILKVYDNDGKAHSDNFQDFAVIKDFNPHDDVICLHGDANNYTLINIHGSTAIFYDIEGETPELIGFVFNQTDVNLATDDFEFAEV